MPTVVLAVPEAMLASFAGAGKALCRIVPDFVVTLAGAALNLVEVLAGVKVNNFMSLAHLSAGDVGCDCFDVDHCRKSLSLFVLFTDKSIASLAYTVKYFSSQFIANLRN